MLRFTFETQNWRKIGEKGSFASEKRVEKGRRASKTDTNLGIVTLNRI